MILPGSTVGMLGGGQLGRMFVHAAQAMGFKVAVVGATGNVGREMLNILAERRFPADEVVALASSKSIGKAITRSRIPKAIGPLTAGLRTIRILPSFASWTASRRTSRRCQR